ncbi:MAG: polyphosphate kinase, partial [Rhodospirillaceae bacterium]|nr:polyphosphate kinase [Rhodospirillaceae bacterium]
MATARSKTKLGSLPSLPKRTEAQNEKLTETHQEKLVRIQQAYLFTGERAVVVFEGMDAAGKGGTIRRIAWAMDPRSLKVWPIGAPNEIERRQHYLQRFWSRLPERTQISVFDRSWYGRVLVERVEDLAKPAEWKRAYGEINDFEQQLVDDGIRVVKFFLHVSKDEQLRRLEDRLRNPLKRWKLSYEDFRNRDKWKEYVEAAEEMFARTSTSAAPWHVITSNDKAAARVQVLSILAQRLAIGLDLSDPPLDARVLKAAAQLLG